MYNITGSHLPHNTASLSIAQKCGSLEFLFPSHTRVLACPFKICSRGGGITAVIEDF